MGPKYTTIAGTKKEKKHLLILCPGFPKDENDFLCIPPLQAYLLQLKHQHPELLISVLSLHYPEGKSTYQWHDIQVFSPFGINERFPKSLVVKMQGLKLIHSINRLNPITVIHSFWLGDCSFVGDLASRLYGIKHLTTLMGQDAKPTNKWHKYPFQSNHQKVLLSNYQSKILSDVLSKLKLPIIPWGIDQANLPDLNLDQRKWDVLGVGAMIPLKRYDWFLDVIANIVESNSTLKVALIGGGVDLERLQDKVSSLNLTKHLTFLGVLPRSEVLIQMNRARVFLHTSSYESQAYVFNEALAMGMSVVSTDVGIAQASPKWKIAKTIEGLAQAVDESLKEWKKPERVIIHSIENTVKRYLELYRL